MNFSKKFYLGIFIFSFLLPLTAQDSGARFLLLQPSATSQAMGGVGVALHQDVFALYYNPAALAFTKQYSISGSLVKPFPFFGNSLHSFIGAIIPLKHFGTLAVSANLYWKGTQQQVDITGNLIGPVSENNELLNSQLKIAYALPLSRQVSLGVGIGRVQINLSDIALGVRGEKSGASAFFADLGIFATNLLPNLTLKPTLDPLPVKLRWLADIRKYQGISLGISLSNLGSNLRFIEEEFADKLPGKLTIGASYWPLSSEVISAMIAVDLEMPLFEDSSVDYLHLGTQVRFLHLFSLRFGRYIDTTDNLRKSFNTFGGGIHLRYFAFNIARYNRTYRSIWHYDVTLQLEI